MERFAEALARGRPEPEASARASAPQGPAAAPEARRRPQEIVYTRTRKREPDAGLLRENRVLASFGAGPLLDAYKILSIQVLQRLRQNGWNTLAVASPGPREGTTLTALNLAISLSHEVDQTVLLVDADLRKPSLHRHFGFPAQPGLSDHLVAGTPIEDLLVNPGLPRFVLLPGGRPLVNSAEMLGSARMASLVQELKERYASRIVVFDLPPVLASADALAFAPRVDALMLVVAEGRTRRDDIRRAGELLGAQNVLGVALNGSRDLPAASVGENVDLVERHEPQSRHV
jgi:capsular exopolysaccharide synthesis family protein